MEWRWLRFEELDAPMLYDVLHLRSDVFVVEQDCVYQDLDGRDATCRHLLGREQGRLVAYLRGLPPDDGWAAIGRVVVARSHRGLGLGFDLMNRGMNHTWDTFGTVGIKLSAQAYLRSFYERLGFAVTGPGYLEDGIEHLPMQRPFPPM